MLSVGIPQGLFYYYFFPLWKTFFKDLGAKVVTSSATNRHTIDLGIQTAVDETCFPVKVFFGHVGELCSYKLDYIFIPRIVSVEAKSYICPKFMGVPDMIKASISELPPVIDLVIDLSKNDKALRKDILKVGLLFTGNKKLIREAYRHGLNELEFCRSLSEYGYTRAEAIQVWEGETVALNLNHDLSIGILGHGYSLYDNAISMAIIKRLREMRCQVFIPEMLDQEEVESEAATIPKRVFWTLGRKMVGSALYMDKSDFVDGIIYMACFGCGPDSMVGEIVERKVKNKPFMLLTVDEHTGEAGLVTRLEAFCDMLKRRRRVFIESNISTHG